ncbi:TolC family protein [Shewanella sp.]|nr:TolC family protein [Shewanella sp.]
MKRSFCIFLLILPLSIQAKSIDFDHAWQQLLQVSDKLQAGTQEINRAQAEQAAGEDMDLPSINLTGSYTRLEKPLELDLRDLNPVALINPLPALPASLFVTPFSEQDIFRSSLKAMWPIYTGGKITAAQAIHAAKVAEKEAQLTLTTRDLFVSLVDRYYAVSVTKALVDTQKQLVDSLTLHASHAQKLEAQGQIAKVERLSAQVALENAKVSYGSAKRQAEMAMIGLSRMLHEPQVDSLSPMFMLEKAPSLPQLSQLAMNQHPALKLLKAKEDQAQGLINVEKGSYYPTVFLYGNYTLYEDDSLLSKLEPDWMVGVGVNIPLFSRDGRSGKVEAAKSALLQARYTKAQTQQDLNLLLEQSYRQLLQAQEEVLSLNTSLSLAKENKRLRNIAFAQGLSTSIEKIDAELKLTAVETQQLAAQYRYIQAYARLMAISGQLDEFIGRSLEPGEHNAH